MASLKYTNLTDEYNMHIANKTETFLDGLKKKQQFSVNIFHISKDIEVYY